jgi:hypothetical protein
MKIWGQKLAQGLVLDIQLAMVAHCKGILDHSPFPVGKPTTMNQGINANIIYSLKMTIGIRPNPTYILQ